MSYSFLSEIEGRIRIKILVKTNARQSMVVGQHNGRLKVAIKAPALEGKANQALVEFLSKVFDCPQKKLEIEKGLTSREKTVGIHNLSLKSVVAALDAVLGNDYIKG